MRLPLHLLAVLALASTAAAAVPDGAKPKAPKAPRATAGLLDKGRAAFETNCATCHGTGGDGKGPAGMYLTPPPRHFGVDPFKQGDSVEAIFGTLQTGIAGTPMVSFAHLPEDDRWAIAWYVAHFLPTKDGKTAKKLVDALPPLAPPGLPPAPPATTPPATPLTPATPATPTP